MDLNADLSTEVIILRLNLDLSVILKNFQTQAIEFLEILLKKIPDFEPDIA